MAPGSGAAGAPPRGDGVDAAADAAVEACLRRVDVAGVEDAAWRERIAAETEAAERRLRPTSGMMVQALWFDAGPERAGHLWLAIHHLTVDGVSWRILVPDLVAAWQATAAGRAVMLPPRGT